MKDSKENIKKVVVEPIGAIRAKYIEKDGFVFYESSVKNSPTIDFGTIEYNSYNARQFRMYFLNASDRITSVGSSCGCTDPKVENCDLVDNAQILTVIYDTKKVGKSKKSIFLYSNGKKQEIALTVNVKDGV